MKTDTNSCGESGTSNAVSKNSRATAKRSQPETVPEPTPAAAAVDPGGPRRTPMDPRTKAGMVTGPYGTHTFFSDSSSPKTVIIFILD